jgi:hypothetical protein
MTSTRTRFISTATVLLVAICGDRCFADFIAYNNFGTNPIYQPIATWQGSWDSEEGMTAQRFNAKVGGRMTKLETGMTFSPTLHELNVDDITLSLVPDDNGKPGTQVLWSQNYICNVPTIFGSIASFDVEGGPNLTAASKYWVMSRSTSIGRGPHAWSFANQPASEPYAYYYFRSNIFTTGEWVVPQEPPAYRYERTLRITVIPEPSAAALMLAASATLLTVRRRTSL